MISPGHFVVFALDGQRYALSLPSVTTVVRAAEITPLPKAPDIVLGIINVHGQVIPVVDMRKRFRLAPRGMDLRDQLVIAQTPGRLVALLTDSVDGVVEIDEQRIVKTDRVLPHAEYVEGIVKLPDGLLLIHDLGKFLSLDEERSLDNALKTEDRSR